MNDIRKQSSALFTLSGCLTSEALMHFVNGSLPGADQQEANNHIQSCPLCADAADGLRIWLHNSASQQTSETSASDLQGTITGKPEIMPGEAAGMAEKEQFSNRINSININIQRRVLERKRKEIAYNGISAPKPLTWLAAAASVVLLITAGYILWMQDKNDKAMLARQLQRENTPAAVTAYGEMPSPPATQVTAILTVKYTGKKGAHLPPVVTIDNDQTLAPAKTGVNNKIVSSQVEEPEYAETKPGPESELYREEYGMLKGHRSVRNAATKNIGGATRKPDAEEEANAVFMNVQEMPSFPGGDAARKKYLARNLRYPSLAAEEGIQGTVYVSFVVKTNGSLSDIKIIKGIGGGCDQEAMRVVKKMPAWNPGYQNGRKVAVLFNMPVYFRLQ